MFEIYARTEIGQVRTRNEDAFLINRFVAQAGEYHEPAAEEPLFVAVADGMGGAQAGEIASRMTLNACAGLPLPIDGTELVQVLQDRIHAELLTFGRGHPEAAGLGTTFTGVICNDRIVTFVHIGDSRLYRFRDGFLKQLTRDHSLVEMLFSLGQVAAEDRDDHPEKHVLLQCLGGSSGQQHLKIDSQQVRGRAEVGDLFLLCTDGLSNRVRSEEMEAVFSQEASMQTAAARLVQLAFERGGDDNLTIVLVRRTQ